MSASCPSSSPPRRERTCTTFVSTSRSTSGARRLDRPCGRAARSRAQPAMPLAPTLPLLDLHAVRDLEACAPRRQPWRASLALQRGVHAREVAPAPRRQRCRTSRHGSLRAASSSARGSTSASLDRAGCGAACGRAAAGARVGRRAGGAPRAGQPARHASAELLARVGLGQVVVHAGGASRRRRRRPARWPSAPRSAVRCRRPALLPAGGSRASPRSRPSPASGSPSARCRSRRAAPRPTASWPLGTMSTQTQRLEHVARDAWLTPLSSASSTRPAQVRALPAAAVRGRFGRGGPPLAACASARYSSWRRTGLESGADAPASRARASSSGECSEVTSTMRRPQRRGLAHRGQPAPAVHARHLHVDDRQLERVGRRGAVPRSRSSACQAVGRALAAHAPRPRVVARGSRRWWRCRRPPEHAPPSQLARIGRRPAALCAPVTSGSVNQNVRAFARARCARRCRRPSARPGAG